MTDMYNPPHPGRSLKDALNAIPATVEEFAAQHGIDSAYLHKVVACEADITSELSEKVSMAFAQSSPDLWVRMQLAHNGWQAAHPK